MRATSNGGFGKGAHVAVLMGGWSAEREISLVSGRASARALAEQGYRVSEIDVAPDLAAVLEALKPEVVFNALHGRWGEDGCVQGLLELLGLPYTHSGVLASALAMDKPAAKRMFAAAGLPCAKDVVAPRAEIAARHPLDPPYVVKPAAEGSSVGVVIVHEGDDPPADYLYSEHWTFGDMVMAERFIPGRELTVAVMDARALDALEIVPENRAFYDWGAKYAPGGSRHLVPAPLPPDIYAEARRISECAHRVLGCRGVTRADLRYDDTRGEIGDLYLLEVNTQPGMTPTSLVPEIAAHAGLSFGDLVRWMVEDASCSR